MMFINEPKSNVNEGVPLSFGNQIEWEFLGNDNRHK